MSLVRQAQPDPSDRRMMLAVAWVVTFLGYLLTASAYGYWFDAGEFVAAATTLGVAHPPGHPLTALVGRAVAMLPLGPIAWRIALVSAAFAACASAALCGAIDTTVRCLGVRRHTVAYGIALGATFFVAGASGFWFQAVRPEVYALQAALVLFAVERVLWLEASWPTRDLRPLYAAAFAWGLSLANHHLIALLAAPAVIPTLARVQRAQGFKGLLWGLIFACLGLGTYLYLPLRAANHPLPNLGDPVTLQRFFWVISAQAYQKNTGDGVPDPLGDRVADVLVLLVENFHVLCLLALGGLYALLRAPGARRLGSIWAWLLGLALLARAWLGFVRNNPDAAGYLMPAFAAIGALAAAFLAELLNEETGLDTFRPRRTSLIAAALVCMLGLGQLYHGFVTTNLAAFHATDDFDDALRRVPESRPVVLVHHPQTVFRLWSLATEAVARPDQTLVPMPFLEYPGTIEALLGDAPELRGVLRTQRLYGELRDPSLQTLASQRDVLVEMDVRVPPTLYASLAPQGLYYQVIAGGATDADIRLRAARQAETYRELYRALGSQRMEPATRDMLLWRHYTDALYYMGVGHLDEARNAVAQAMDLQPTAEPLPQMWAALEAEDISGPQDVQAFRMGWR